MSTKPPLGNTIDDRCGFVTGEAKVDKPLFIQPLRRFFQQLDLLLIVLNKAIIN